MSEQKYIWVCKETGRLYSDEVINLWLGHHPDCANEDGTVMVFGYRYTKMKYEDVIIQPKKEVKGLPFPKLNRKQRRQKGIK